MEMESTLDGPTPPSPVPRPRIVLQPGQLSKPEKVWASSSALIIGFYQAAPYSDTFKIFYKKSGSVFGTQVTLQPASILGPELAVRQPVTGEVQYFEYEIKKLKPSTQYVIKIKTSDQEQSEVRSDKMGTVSYEEERTRDNDMRNFVGALVKLGEYDGLIMSYASATGIFAVRILQLDDIASSLQLARLTSDYTDNGVPVQAYTLSQIRFGRWGGAITGSKVVNEGELKWLVARAVQMGQKSEAAVAFEAEKKMLQTQVEMVASNLDSQWTTRFRNLRLRAIAYLLLLALVAVCGGGGMWSLLSRSGRRHRELLAELAGRGSRIAEMEAELQMLHLYRVSLELDVERRVAGSLGAAGAGWVAAGTQHLQDPIAAAVAGGGNSSSGSSSRRLQSVGVFLNSLAGHNATAAGSSSGGGTSGSGRKGGKGGAGGRKDGDSGRGGISCPTNDGRVRAARRSSDSGARSEKGSRRRQGDTSRRPADKDRGRQRSSSGGRGTGSNADASAKRKSGAGTADDGAGGAAVGSGGSARDLWGLPHQALRKAIARSAGPSAPPAAGARRQSAVLDGGGSGNGLGAGGGGGGSDGGGGGLDGEQPDAWMFIHYVSHVYAMHLQEWMHVQLQKTVRRKVNEMLQGPQAGGGVAAPNSSSGGSEAGAGRDAAGADGGERTDQEGEDEEGEGEEEHSLGYGNCHGSDGDGWCGSAPYDEEELYEAEYQG